jgi:acyl-CoA thioesterase-1
MPDTSRPCEAQPGLVDFRYDLPHFRQALKSQRKIKIVAIGSSSTAGVGGVLPFPHRLEMLLRQHYYGRMIDVLNRGIGGQEAPEELSRLKPDAIDEAPALIIWQVGTNAVYRNVDYNPDEVSAAIELGLDWLADIPSDVVLMDLQYTSAMVDKIDLSLEMEKRIAAAGDKAKINVFRRFALMKRWNEDNIPLPELDDGGKLHTGEWATKCVATALAGAIIGAPQAST